MANLAARCPACNTAFRVVPDQLRVSEGWVRCGRCGEVFNANQTLIDLDTGVSAEPEVPRDPAPLLDRVLTPPPPDALQEPTPSGLEFDLQIAPATPGAASFAALEGAPAGIEASPAPHPFAADPRAAPEDRPSFVRRAERAELWRQPKVRIVLAVLTVLAALGLLAQTAFEYRDLIAARLPVARAALQEVCAALNCRVGPVHAIESLAVESSGLVRVEKSNVYKLQLALRNRADLPIALPALDLSLTDTQGKLLSRRMLRMAEFGVTQDTLAAGRELAIQATLQAAGEPVSGYTLELFYP